jgi:hypothetical protein
VCPGCGYETLSLISASFCPGCWQAYQERIRDPGTGDFELVLHREPDDRRKGEVGWAACFQDVQCPDCKASRTGLCEQHYVNWTKLHAGGGSPRSAPLDDPGEYSSLWSNVVRGYEQDWGLNGAPATP